MRNFSRALFVNGNGEHRHRFEWAMAFTVRLMDLVGTSLGSRRDSSTSFDTVIHYLDSD